MAKKKRCAFTVEFKCKITKCVEENLIKKILDIAKEFKIPPSVLAIILKNNE